MSRPAVFRRSLSLAAATGAFFATVPGLAVAAGGTTAPSCNAPALAQVYSWAQDTYWYAPIPGEKWDGMSSSGWTLSGGAKIVSTTLADGQKGSVLDLPSGSKAVTPQLCISNSYPFGRTEMRNVLGSQGVSIFVSYRGVKSWGANLPSGSATGVSNVWSLPSPFAIPPSSVTGWQYAKFTFTALGSKSEYQLSNLYIDPRMH